MPSTMPRRLRSAAPMPWWVVVIGCVTRLSTPPRLGAIVKYFSRSTHHGGGGLCIAVINEAKDAAEAAHLCRGDRVSGKVGQARIVDLLHLGAIAKITRDSERGGVLLANAHDERAKTAGEQESDLGGHYLSEVLAPRPEPVDVWLGGYDDAAREIAVTAEILGRAMDDDVGTEREGRLVDR